MSEASVERQNDKITAVLAEAANRGIGTERNCGDDADGRSVAVAKAALGAPRCEIPEADDPILAAGC